MEISILEKKENPLLRRTELVADVSYEGATPTRQEMREELSKKLKVSPELVVVRHIYPFFGDKKAEVVVHVYQNKEDVDKIESKVYLERMLGKKEEKEEKREEEKEEKKKEKGEKKEEKKKETGVKEGKVEEKKGKKKEKEEEKEEGRKGEGKEEEEG